MRRHISWGPLVLVILAWVLPAGAQTVVQTNGFNGSLGWTEYHPSETTADWEATSSSSCPSVGALEGSGMARFNSCSAYSGDEARITSGALNLSGAEVAEVRFFMYHDTAYSSDDYIRFQITTDSWDRYYTLAEMRRNNGSSGWSEVTIPLGYFTGRSDLKIAFRGRSRNGGNIYIDDLVVEKATLPAGAEGKACAVDGDCDSNLCGHDPHGNRRCRGAGTACIGAHREPVSSGTSLCAGLDVATCSGTDTWNLTDCDDDCGPYLDVHGCDVSGTTPSCAECELSCVDLFGISEGCDADAYCQMVFIFGECHFKKANGQGCGSDRECLSDNCVGAPGGSTYCEPASTPCAGVDGSPVTAGTVVCQGGDRWTCQANGWNGQDCYANCGFYLDVDSCTGGVCQTCPNSCTDSAQCKPGILCTGGACVGGLDLGATCTLDSQCDSDHCVDGHCCGDICTAPCYSCAVDDSGICKAIPNGQDPADECPGQGPCDGSCNGLGGCNYPQGAVCGVCARCNQLGQCSTYVAAGTDPDGECPVCQVCSGSAVGCTMVAAGQDPTDDCPQSGQSSCGLDGLCDGGGACRNWPVGTECTPGSCSSGTMLLPDTCDGAGLCVDRGNQLCHPYRCADATACASSCASHATCVPEAFCAANGSCQADLGDGADCAAVVFAGNLDDAACMGGYCFDDNFDGLGAFCTSLAGGCVHDGLDFGSGYALCSGDDWFRVCAGGAPGWGAEVGCQEGLCDAGGGPGSGIRQAGSCSSGPGGGCSSTCQSCSPYLAASATACASSCVDAGDCWPGYECDQGSCRVPEGLGEICANQSDCLAGICTDGRCCENACVGPCRACNLPGSEGFCAWVDVGADPDGDCATEQAETCGLTGACDGQGGCQLWPAGQVCRGAHCEANTWVLDSRCDGAGLCVAAAEDDCRPGICGPSGCSDTCGQHDDCDPGGFCASDGRCATDLADGQDCQDVVLSGLSEHAACHGGFCYPDGFNESGFFCASEVDACVVAGQQVEPGYRLCADATAYRLCLGGDYGWGSFVDCSGVGVCDAGGGIGSGIVPPGVCTSGLTGGCTAACQSCYPYRAVAAGQCGLDCDEDNDCWPGHSCAAGACGPDEGLGDACEDGSTCGVFPCVDGVCCNLDCDGPCTLCNDPLAYGVCLNAIKGTDPNAACEPGDACGLTGVCDGLGQCAVQPAGTECAAAACVDGLLTSAGRCDGQGACQAGREHACPSGACLDQACAPEVADGGVADAEDGSDGGPVDGGDAASELRAEAGPLQIVRPGVQIQLDGSGSVGPVGTSLSYLWEQSSGPESVSLSGATTAGPTFVPEREGVYVFRLVVAAAGQQSDPDFTEVHAQAKAGGCDCSAGGGSGISLLGLWLALGLALRRRRGQS